MDLQQLQLLPDLELNKDYRGVNYEVWTLLKRIYGGGEQEVVRECLDIYSTDAIDTYFLFENQNKIQEQEREEEEEQKFDLARA